VPFDVVLRVGVGDAVERIARPGQAASAAVDLAVRVGGLGATRVATLMFRTTMTGLDLSVALLGRGPRGPSPARVPVR
jgi:hypothetical protein